MNEYNEFVRGCYLRQGTVFKENTDIRQTSCGLRTARKETPINLKTEMFCIVYAENEITDRKELMCWSISVQT